MILFFKTKKSHFSRQTITESLFFFFLLQKVKNPSRDFFLKKMRPKLVQFSHGVQDDKQKSWGNFFFKIGGIDWIWRTRKSGV